MEFGFLRKIEFFPQRPKLDQLDELCLATKSRNLGDALVLTSLAQGLKRMHPRMRLTTYVRGFNPVAFAANPAIEGVSRLPRAIYGDDCNEGGGNLIHMKERFFGLPLSPSPKPEIFLRDEETAWATRYVAFNSEPSRARLPKIFLHPWGVTRKQALDHAAWDAIVHHYRDRFSFWQLGVEWHSAIAGCDHYVFLSRRPAEARKLFALMPHARAFMGVDSAPMHVARAFERPSLVWTTHSPQTGKSIQDWIRHRDSADTPIEPSFAFLYQQNTHAVMSSDPEEALETAESFLARFKN